MRPAVPTPPAEPGGLEATVDAHVQQVTVTDATPAPIPTGCAVSELTPESRRRSRQNRPAGLREAQALTLKGLPGEPCEQARLWSLIHKPLADLTESPMISTVEGAAP
jgi:hypothetical protein